MRAGHQGLNPSLWVLLPPNGRESRMTAPLGGRWLELKGGDTRGWILEGVWGD